MTNSSWWKRSLMILGVVAAGFAAMAADPRAGTSAEPPPAQGGEKNLYRGSLSCKVCHKVRDNPDYRPAIGFVMLDEFNTWSEKDKHTLAYSNLLGPRGKQMASRLGIDDLTAPSAGCIGCHGAREAEINQRTEGDVFNAAEGVSCENCHGPSSRWWAPHVDTSFRKKTAEERERLGMIDLRSPVKQAGQCLTCHIGNSAEGKVVTHDMYAAGHPPLPSIEVATFSDVIPRHWWLDSEKPAFERKPPPDFVPGRKERTRLAIVAAAVALKTSMKLLADETRESGQSTTPGLDWPDYARFDCWSCHHDLRREGWRQARGFQAAPGRPPIGEWPLAIVELGIDRLVMGDKADGALRDELADHQKEVLGQANGRPFGKKVPLAKAAEDFAKWSDVLIEKLSKASYDDAIALQLLQKLVAKARERLTDYDEARHIAWTIKILAADAGPSLPNRDKIGPILAKFDEKLRLVLPAGRDHQIDDQLGKALQAIGDYEPSEFRRHLKELAALLPPA